MDDFRNGTVGNIANVVIPLGTYDIGNVLDEHHITIRITKNLFGKVVFVWDEDE